MSIENWNYKAGNGIDFWRELEIRHAQAVSNT